MKTILFSAGGTLGHIMPALTFIQKLKTDLKDIKIIFIATTKDQNYELLTNNKFIDKSYYLKAYGKPTKIIKYPSIIYHDLLTCFTIKRILKKEHVNLVIGMGGYISGLSIYMANMMKIKTIIHEQNSTIGFANKINLKKTNLILTTFNKTYGLEKYQTKTIWLGNPRYDIATSYQSNNFLDKKAILITSGSIGSKKINEVAKDFINSPYAKDYQITLVTGKKYYEQIVDQIPKRYNFIVKPFSTNLLEDINKANIIISRAGATTLFEILGAKRLAIIIPSPNVSNNHQYYNALSLKDEGLIEMLEEKDLTYQSLYEAITNISLNQASYLNKLKSNHQYGKVCDKFINIIKEFI